MVRLLCRNREKGRLKTEQASTRQARLERMVGINKEIAETREGLRVLQHPNSLKRARAEIKSMQAEYELLEAEEEEAMRE